MDVIFVKKKTNENIMENLKGFKWKTWQLSNATWKEGLERDHSPFIIWQKSESLNWIEVKTLVRFKVQEKRLHPKSNENHQHHCYGFDVKIEASLVSVRAFIGFGNKTPHQNPKVSEQRAKTEKKSADRIIVRQIQARIYK